MSIRVEVWERVEASFLFFCGIAVLFFAVRYVFGFCCFLCIVSVVYIRRFVLDGVLVVFEGVGEFWGISVFFCGVGYGYSVCLFFFGF